MVFVFAAFSRISHASTDGDTIDYHLHHSIHEMLWTDVTYRKGETGKQQFRSQDMEGYTCRDEFPVTQRPEWRSGGVDPRGRALGRPRTAFAAAAAAAMITGKQTGAAANTKLDGIGLRTAEKKTTSKERVIGKPTID